LDLRKFFDVTSVLLLLFAAGLVAHGVHEFQEAALLPVIVEHVWDMNAILDETALIGTLAKSLFGYNGNPSLLEVLALLWVLRNYPHQHPLVVRPPRVRAGEGLRKGRRIMETVTNRCVHCERDDSQLPLLPFRFRGCGVVDLLRPLSSFSS